MGAMRPALRYTPLNPAGQGYFPGNGKVFSCRNRQGSYSDGSMCGQMEECERVVSGRKL
jgi:hypothetical protein